MFEKYFHFRIRCGIILEKANICSENMFDIRLRRAMR